ncbi:hypothetical protein PTE30175_01244 [Pandoraea terrae]|uniref:Type III secretion system protein PrgH n=1 Tax=Pandoraea terrae TaxID=1537710 RepID=A0A5E4TBX2_9BURK|nr:PrgH/EprH family type III secretion apparatus protein [Pandoraea terrae]VVD84792.1 hypothetical protein PTE30175_01244 [Pandoraea terrae]
MGDEDAHEMSSAELPRAMLRLLNGPLRGCEFPLLTGVSLFVVGPSDPLLDRGWQTEMPTNAVFIPMDDPGDNFEVLIDVEDHPGIHIRVLHDHDCSVFAVGPEQVVNVGNMRVAIRPWLDAWSEVALQAERSGHTGKDLRGGAGAFKRGMVLASVISVTVVLATIVYQRLETAPRRQAKDVANALRIDEARYQVLGSRKGDVYIVARQSDDAARMRRAVSKTPYAASVRVVGEDDERKRIVAWLDGADFGIALFQLHFDDACHPALWVSRERSDISLRNIRRVNDGLKARFPYVEEVRVIGFSDVDVLQQAEEGMSRQALPYSMTRSADGVTFHVVATLDDIQLQRMQQFTGEFARRWGTRYVRFSVDLADDPLKNRSYRYGGGGYVKNGPAHWNFVRNLH